jgi:hypothetical protein
MQCLGTASAGAALDGERLDDDGNNVRAEVTDGKPHGQLFEAPWDQRNEHGR